MCASLQSPEACIRTEGSVPSASFLQSPRALSDHDCIPSLDSGSRPSATSTPTSPSPLPASEKCVAHLNPHTRFMPKGHLLCFCCNGTQEAPAGRQRNLDTQVALAAQYSLCSSRWFPCTPSGCPNPSTSSRQSPSGFPSWHMPSPLTS